MTLEEAIKSLQNIVEYWTYKPTEVEAAKMAIAALRHQIWEEQVWHDAKTDPPKTSGLYYGKKDDTNSMYACRYRDGVWVLDMYPQQQMDIVQWADYAAFVRQDEDTALRSVSREQMEKLWRGEWKGVPKLGVYDMACSKCGYSPGIRFYSANFCPHCGAPMTDEAVDMMLEMWKEAVDSEMSNL